MGTQTGLSIVLPAPCVRHWAAARANRSIEGSLMTVVAVVGLGYVGLPLAVEFGKRLNDRLRSDEAKLQRIRTS